MSLFKSGNPALNEETFDENSFSQDLESLQVARMTVRGAAGKFGAMMLMLMAAATFSWVRIAESDSARTWIIGSAIGGFVLALIIMFKKEWAQYLALGYAMLEGFFLGAVSALLNAAYAERFPGLASQAVLLTAGVALAMFGLYYFRVLRATPLLTRVIVGATLGIAVFYLFRLGFGLFGVVLPFGMADSSPLSIGISLFIVGIAAFRLILDFDNIEQGAAVGAPKYYEWYTAFGLTLTIVWLYLEILKLLVKIAGGRR
ncbi:Bax inhibitor-1/YccA family protein [Flaviaesturariibacter amylovorans]|uniref:Bax inhibitor-1/YccA family protein n=1 Tax=Flaviaesturariibacter amylovorans TaxID=1084520 RepID=A0ABP8G691_9BACT